MFIIIAAAWDSRLLTRQSNMTMASLTQPNGGGFSPPLLDHYQETLKWKSVTGSWQNELSFLQRTLDNTVNLFPSEEDKRPMRDLQNRLLYYRSEVVIDVREKLLKHERRLADTFMKRETSDNPCYRAHLLIAAELEEFAKTFTALTHDFFKCCEKLNKLR